MGNRDLGTIGDRGDKGRGVGISEWIEGEGGRSDKEKRGECNGERLLWR